VKSHVVAVVLSPVVNAFLGPYTSPGFLSFFLLRGGYPKEPASFDSAATFCPLCITLAFPSLLRRVWLTLLFLHPSTTFWIRPGCRLDVGAAPPFICLILISPPSSVEPFRSNLESGASPDGSVPLKKSLRDMVLCIYENFAAFFLANARDSSPLIKKYLCLSNAPSPRSDQRLPHSFDSLLEQAASRPSLGVLLPGPSRSALL